MIKMNTYIKFTDDHSNSLTHYGVKGMKWRHHKSGLVTLDLGQKSPAEQALDTIKERLEGEKKAKEILAKKQTATPAAKSLGEAEIAKLSSNVIRGNYGNGRARIKSLKSQGYSSNDIIRIQSHVNKQYGINSGASENFKKQVSEEFASAPKAATPSVSSNKSKSMSTSSSSSKTSTTKTKKAKSSSKSTRKKTSSKKSKRKRSITKVTRKSLDTIEEEIKRNG